MIRERLGKELLYFDGGMGNPFAGKRIETRRAAGDMEPDSPR